MKRLFIITIILIFQLSTIIQCRSSQEDSAALLGFDYLDGSSNKYSITSSRIVYVPVTPHQSSSGIYSGGKPFEVNITKEQFNQLKLIFQKSWTNKTGQTDKRSMGTGMLIVLPENIVYIFEMNSTQKKDIENALKLMTKK